MTAQQHPRLTPKEWALVVELLEQESDELPAELHHTEAPEMREALHERTSLVRDLLVRLHGAFSPGCREGAADGEGDGKESKRASRSVRPTRSAPKLLHSRCCSARTR